MPSSALALTRARECDACARKTCARMVVDEWPDRSGESAGFLGIKSSDERELKRRVERLILTIDDDDGDGARAVACVCVRESCAIRDVPEARNVLLHSLVVAPSSRGNGFGEETARRAKAFAFKEMGADVVTVWCEPGLVDWYVERCGFTREAPMGRASDDDGGDVCCRAFASAHVRARYEAVRVGA